MAHGMSVEWLWIDIRFASQRIGCTETVKAGQLDSLRPGGEHSGVRQGSEEHEHAVDRANELKNGYTRLFVAFCLGFGTVRAGNCHSLPICGRIC